MCQGRPVNVREARNDSCCCLLSETVIAYLAFCFSISYCCSYVVIPFIPLPLPLNVVVPSSKSLAHWSNLSFSFTVLSVRAALIYTALVVPAEKFTYLVVIMLILSSEAAISCSVPWAVPFFSTSRHLAE